MILLDTHSLLWALADDPKLGPSARNLIATSSVRFVSAVTHAELTIKSMGGKLRIGEDFAARVSSAGFESLPLHERHVGGLRAFDTLIKHGPFDRLLLAQAKVDGLRFVTADRALLDLGEPWIVDARS